MVRILTERELDTWRDGHIPERINGIESSCKMPGDLIDTICTADPVVSSCSLSLSLYPIFACYRLTLR